MCDLPNLWKSQFISTFYNICLIHDPHIQIFSLTVLLIHLLIIPFASRVLHHGSPFVILRTPVNSCCLSYVVDKSTNTSFVASTVDSTDSPSTVFEVEIMPFLVLYRPSTVFLPETIVKFPAVLFPRNDSWQTKAASFVSSYTEVFASEYKELLLLNRSRNIMAEKYFHRG